MIFKNEKVGWIRVDAKFNWRTFSTLSPDSKLHQRSLKQKPQDRQIEQNHNCSSMTILWNDLQKNTSIIIATFVKGPEQKWKIEFISLIFITSYILFGEKFFYTFLFFLQIFHSENYSCVKQLVGLSSWDGSGDQLNRNLWVFREN